jgi:AcrR family transcriptional regulator
MPPATVARTTAERTSAAQATAARSSARERLLTAADELFYDEGVHTVGIDRVIERAGVAKASLYNTFGSKDELVRAYLERRHAARRARLSEKVASLPTPRERLLGVFDAQSELAAAVGYRGCAFANASAESTPGGSIEAVCDDARAWIRELFAELAAAGGARDPDALAAQLMLLYDGAAVSTRMDRDPAAARMARTVAETLVDAALRG